MRMDNIDDIQNYLTIVSRLLLAPHVAHCYDARVEEIYTPDPHRPGYRIPTGLVDRVSISVKTKTPIIDSPLDYFATELPSEEAMSAVEAISDDFGFAGVHFEPTENGFGVFVFKLPETIKTE